MYNYVCATFTFDKKGDLIPHAIKVGVTSDCSQRFPKICKEVEKEEYPFGSTYVAVLPLFIIGGDYDKYIGERVEDILRLYYLKKLGFDRGYKQDWINPEGLPAEYDIEAENTEIEALLTEWFPNQNINIYYKYSAETDVPKSLVFGSFHGKFYYRYGLEKN